MKAFDAAMDAAAADGAIGGGNGAVDGGNVADDIGAVAMETDGC